ncbi:MAG: hypothetical protein WAN47_05270 [Nitrosotalea sp.]
MSNLDEIREKLTSKEERLKILGEINDLTYFGQVDLTIKKMSKEEEHEQITLLRDRAEYLRNLVNLCFEEIERLEEEK